MTEQNKFAAMLRAVRMPSDEAFHLSMGWTRLGVQHFGASSAIHVFHPWAAPDTGTLWHKAYALGGHMVSEEVHERVRTFVRFWETVDFTIGPGLTDPWAKYSVPDAERALTEAYEVRQAGYDQFDIIRAARVGQFDELVSLVRADVPRDYVETLLR